MATLLLTVAGTALGGPLGGAVGGLIGRQVDRSVFGDGSREGPRLKELSVTTSSYGQPIPRIFGRMRIAGSIVWSTELRETSSKEGGKGQPSTTTYSYSASFAVALSSTPLSRIGRIWADGNLLRGVGEDLKVEGSMRIYLGTGDNSLDPLIVADKGASATAFRDCAYIVFEDLQLADFGNRIPALTFEVFGSDPSQVSLEKLVPAAQIDPAGLYLNEARGFADEGGAVSGSLSTIDQITPLSVRVLSDGLSLSTNSSLPAIIRTLPPQLSAGDSSEVAQLQRRRGERSERQPQALRYYDEDRDYQPGVQRANGLRGDGRELMLDLPATLEATGAKRLATVHAYRSRWRAEQMTWRTATLDPQIAQGSIVRLPDAAGYWLIKSWEWHSEGVELALERVPATLEASGNADPGVANVLPDVSPPPTMLSVFEVPSETASDPDRRKIFAATSAIAPSWNGAALFAEDGATLKPLGNAPTERAVSGQLTDILAASASHLFEPNSSLTVQIAAGDLGFADTDISGLAVGSNRLLVGDEIIQFATAEHLGNGVWTLSGLLRGRGGTENSAAMGHAKGSPVIALDTGLTLIDPQSTSVSVGNRIAAVGRGDTEPVFANLQNAGLSRRPLSPVHAKSRILPTGALELCWTRRARGQWHWDTLFELPLVEQDERYEVGLGPIDGPTQIWTTSEPRIELSAASQTTIGSGSLWVRQVGTYAKSPPLHLATLS